MKINNNPEQLKELIVAQAAELASLRAELADEKAAKDLWYNLKCEESDRLAKTLAAHDGMEKLYAQRGDRIKELEATLASWQAPAVCMGAGTPGVEMEAHNG